ncbi:hypothetical protein G6F46_008595 [Rhizopus delemar]|uniref:Uncharacterized protein n=3 Tax=Rhizopus TaxID=4842 RepID=I1BSW9_RHIO9|nr:hypothetical protein RO3G_04004 [Rhizopus delemar RA 99-880]KAG1465833.1 hypothetical protein G6F55_000881 [Rhizopus delemar]KAG1545341.1 hypothetical protein G6F51_005527 [Rhizopus arrhizus]KAG1508273.1 hypothetical protein G6F53_008319 [Rhizopus delemar]KAG1549456.1 hypothetical protein G6F49_009589 [Rhizopus delemar]|eukprot:EIE79299.1 hypothetical protein RO3G_04004 [Rhizopus delemar RA 99-880]
MSQNYPIGWGWLPHKAKEFLLKSQLNYTACKNIDSSPNQLENSKKIKNFGDTFKKIEWNESESFTEKEVESLSIKEFSKHSSSCTLDGGSNIPPVEVTTFDISTKTDSSPVRTVKDDAGDCYDYLRQDLNDSLKQCLRLENEYIENLGASLFISEISSEGVKNPIQSNVSQKIALDLNISKRAISNAIGFPRAVITVSKTKELCDDLLGRCHLKSGFVVKKRAVDLIQQVVNWREDKKQQRQQKTSFMIAGMSKHDIYNIKNIFEIYNYPYPWTSYLTSPMTEQLAKIQRETNKKSRSLSYYGMGYQLAVIRLSYTINANVSFLKSINAVIKKKSNRLDDNYITRRFEELELIHLDPPKVLMDSIVETCYKPHRCRYNSLLLNTSRNQGQHPVSSAIRDKHVPFNQRIVVINNEEYKKKHKPTNKPIKFRFKMSNK